MAAAAPTTDQLEQKVQQFQDEGYFIVENLVSPDEVCQLLQRLDDYVEERRPLPEGLHLQVEPTVERGEMAAGRANRFRKMWPTVPTDDLFTQLALKPELVHIMQALMGPNLKLFRDAVMMKPPGIGSAKGVHQDSPYWPIEPMALASYWIALDPATRSNGCMTVIPGSHKWGPQPHVTTTDDFVIPEEHYNAADLVPVELAPGSALVFHSLMIHGSAPNTSSDPRRALVLSYMSSAYRFTSPGPKPDFFRIAGEDVPGGV
jgi:ectoine hydroxylase-related dioxygenase (phytanoyl-CoA dioxygenase family)